MATFGQLNQANRRVFVSGVSTLATTGVFKDLAPEQLGVFEVAENGVISIASGKVKKAIIAQGVADFAAAGNKNGGAFSNGARKTIEFNPKNIVAWRGIKASTAEMSDKVALGYDGVDAAKTITTLLDVKDLIVHVRLWGAPVQKVTGNAKMLRKQYYLNKGCLPSNADLTSTVSVNTLLDSFIKQVNEDKWMGYPVTDLFSVKKVLNPATSAPGGLVGFTQYTIKLNDAGEVADLGKLQAFYPGYEVKFESRTGVQSTYSMWRLTSAGAPADYTSTPFSIADCETCPAGSTRTDNYKTYELVGLAATAAPIIPSQIASPVLVGNDGVQKKYLLTMPDNSVDATVIADSLTDGYVATYLSLTRDVCTFATTTTAWVSGTTGSKAPKTWKITLADNVCGTSRLAELQAAYPGLTIAQDVDGECSRSYVTTNYSEVIVPGCYEEDYVYTAPAGYKDSVWIPFVTTLTSPDCTVDTVSETCTAGGLIFETKGVKRPKVNAYTYGYYGYDITDVDPVHIQVSVHSLDYTGNTCDEPLYPVTRLQSVVYPKGEGRYVMERERESLNYELKHWSTNPLVNDAYGFLFNAKEGVYYDEYQLELTSSNTVASSFGQAGGSTVSLYSFYFPANQGKAFESKINSLIVDNKLDLDLIYL